MGMTTDKLEKPRKRGWLINRNFTLLSIGQAISNMGDFVYSTTLLIWVFALGGSAAAVSGVLAAQYAPMLILGPLAGVFVDRWQRLRTMLTSDLTRAVIALLPLAAPEGLRLPVIYLSVFLISVISRFFQPARSALVQVIVAEEEQAQAAAIGQVTFALSIVIGPALASPLYFLIGPIGAILVNAASYVGSALCLWRMRVPEADLLPVPGKGKTGSLAREDTPQGIKAVLREMLEGFIFVGKTRVLLLVAILAMIAMFGAGAINSLDIIYVSQRLHANPNLYGYVTAASGLGALIGALVCGVLAKRISSRVMLAGSLIFCGIGIVIYALQTWIVLGVIFAFIISLPQGGIDVGFTPILMSVTPRRFMGRVGSILDTGISGATLLAIALCGALGNFVPVYLLLLVGGVLITIAGTFGWLALPATVPSAQGESAESLPAREPVPVD